MKPIAGDREAFASAVNATAEQIADLVSFHERLANENARFNLVGPSALAEFWPRHVFDSAQLLGVAPEARVWADLGAGAGFPGIVLAILLKRVEGAQVHLVESQAKRARFLQTIVDDLQLPSTVHARRAESFAPAPACAIVTARACAPLLRLFDYALPFTRAGAVGLFLKGRNADAELADARAGWRVEAEMIPSRSDPEGRIVRVRSLARGSASADRRRARG